MIFGDPYKFAIQFDFVEDWFLEWGEDLKNDGVFHYIIQGYILPVELKKSINQHSRCGELIESKNRQPE